MDKFSHAVVRHRKLILILCLLLCVPSVIGMLSTRINYDMLTYLPDGLDTVTGQDILMDDYGKGAFSIIVIEDQTPEKVEQLRSDISQVDHVDSVIAYSSVLSADVPLEILPEKYYEAFNKGDDTLMAVFFDTSTSADETIEAIGEIRQAAGKTCYVTGMSALVKDLKDLCEQEEPVYVGLAVLCATAAMVLLLDSWVIPFIFLAGIGITILYNLGSNLFFGEISYITKALAAVLQLAVTMDYSIFLWHSFEEEQDLQDSKEDAMAAAIRHTIASVIGSSVTTIAGFIALCFMSFTLGKDLGIVMAKGVLLGVIGCVTILPALILTFDRIIEKTRHRSLIPEMKKLASFVVKKSPVFLVIFVVVLGPAVYGYNNTNIYYDMAGALPEDMDFVIANEKLMDEFDMATTHMLLVDQSLDRADVKEMTERLEDVDGIKAALSLDSVLGSTIPEEILPDEAVTALKSGKYQLMLAMSEYRTASKEVNRQLTAMNDIVKEYDENGMIIGEAACTKDLMKTTDRDFKIVSAVSIVLIFIIIALVLKSASLPVILVMTIYFAIFINLGLPYYTGTWLPFIAPICLTTIQLGSTVDYAILMTTRYKRERLDGQDRDTAVITALHTSIPSVLVSALGFFAATFGVAVYSEIDIISSMCSLMARGALVSMLAVIFILPAFLRLLDPLIIRTTGGMKGLYKNRKKEGTAA